MPWSPTGATVLTTHHIHKTSTCEPTACPVFNIFAITLSKSAEGKGLALSWSKTDPPSQDTCVIRYSLNQDIEKDIPLIMDIATLFQPPCQKHHTAIPSLGRSQQEWLLAGILSKTHAGECSVELTSSQQEIKLTPQPSDAPVHLSSGPLPEPLLSPHMQGAEMEPCVLLSSSMPKIHSSECSVALTSSHHVIRLTHSPHMPLSISPQDPSLSLFSAITHRSPSWNTACCPHSGHSTSLQCCPYVGASRYGY